VVNGLKELVVRVDLRAVLLLAIDRANKTFLLVANLSDNALFTIVKRQKTYIKNGDDGCLDVQHRHCEGKDKRELL
jgi:hypothetical protein